VKIFISWSGAAAREFALFLRGWVRQVVQAVEPFMSEQDVGKGARNVLAMSEELESAQFGIVVVTRDNVSAPWINFEAGAISKSLGTGRLVPLLLDVAKSDVAGPLAQFQAVDASDHADVLRLFQEINKWLRQPLEPDVLLVAVRSWLPEFDAALREHRAAAAGRGTGVALRADRDVLDEILLIVRDLRAAPPNVDESYPSTVNAAQKGWLQQLRWLDENFAGGHLSIADYRRLRNELFEQVDAGKRGELPP
jgi:hypothetical protein